jgi:uncharacterized protein
MDLFIYIFMFSLSLFTAVISAATGMGGGVVFLVGINSFLPLTSSIPIHGLIQLKNNALRVFALRAHLNYSICIPFFFGCLGGVLLVTQLAKSMDNKLVPSILILTLVLYSLFKPKKMPQLKIANWAFLPLGFITGFLGIVVGAVDPILSPFFLRDDFSRHQIIANKSFFQVLVHLAKIPVFLYLGFNYVEHWKLILVLVAGGVLGTYLGIRLLDRISQRVFIRTFRSILFLVAIKLAYNIFQIV